MRLNESDCVPEPASHEQVRGENRSSEGDSSPLDPTERRRNPAPWAIARDASERDVHLDYLHHISGQLATADPLHKVLDQIVNFLNGVVGADSCFLYALEGRDLVLKASKNPHPESAEQSRIPVGEGVTGRVAQRRQAVVIRRGAMRDARFRSYSHLPEDRFEAFLSVPILVGGRLVGVLNLHHGKPYEHAPREIKLVSTVGHLVCAEIERVRLDSEVAKLTGELETRKLLERAKGILQRDMGITEEHAYLRLRQESRRRRITMKQVGEAIVLSDDLRRNQGRQ